MGCNPNNKKPARLSPRGLIRFLLSVGSYGTTTTTGGALSWLSPVELRAVTVTLTLVPDTNPVNVASGSVVNNSVISEPSAAFLTMNR